MEPNISDQVYAALYAPTAGIVCPFHLNIALAENAYANGVDFRFNTEVLDIKKMEEGYELITNHGNYHTRYVVNAAGVYADRIHNMVSEHKIHITPRRGDYCLLDKSAGKHVKPYHLSPSYPKRKRRAGNTDGTWKSAGRTDCH